MGNASKTPDPFESTLQIHPASLARVGDYRLPDYKVFLPDGMSQDCPYRLPGRILFNLNAPCCNNYLRP
jgi:hypothetical protein